jgi:hypothetical protein
VKKQYQEQLAKAAEQLRFFRRAMFGQRRERYAPSPDQKLLFVPETIEGGYQGTALSSNALNAMLSFSFPEGITLSSSQTLSQTRSYLPPVGLTV